MMMPIRTIAIMTPAMIPIIRPPEPPPLDSGVDGAVFYFSGSGSGTGIGFT